LAELKLADLGAMEADDFISNGVKHPFYLVVATFVEGDFHTGLTKDSQLNRASC
jgi:hypothetical protein